MSIAKKLTSEEFAELLFRHFNHNQAALFVIACKNKSSQCYENALDALDNTSFGERGVEQAKAYIAKAEYWDDIDGIISRKLGDIPC